jgi:hypothetical protein
MELLILWPCLQNIQSISITHITKVYVSLVNMHIASAGCRYFETTGKPRQNSTGNYFLHIFILHSFFSCFHLTFSIFSLFTPVNFRWHSSNTELHSVQVVTTTKAWVQQYITRIDIKCLLYTDQYRPYRHADVSDSRYGWSTRLRVGGVLPWPRHSCFL